MLFWIIWIFFVSVNNGERIVNCGVSFCILYHQDEWILTSIITNLAIFWIAASVIPADNHRCQDPNPCLKTTGWTHFKLEDNPKQPPCWRKLSPVHWPEPWVYKALCVGFVSWISANVARMTWDVTRVMTTVISRVGDGIWNGFLNLCSFEAGTCCLMNGSKCVCSHN